MTGLFSIPTLETPRLRLRPFLDRDIEVLTSVYSDPLTMRYLGGCLSPVETWRRMAFHLGHWAILGYGMWAVEHSKTGQLLGRIGFNNPAGWPGFELGWVLGREHWGNGYATEGATAALEYAFSTLRMPRVISLIHPENQASIRVAERIGETFQERITHDGTELLVYSAVAPTIN